MDNDICPDCEYFVEVTSINGDGENKSITGCLIVAEIMKMTGYEPYDIRQIWANAAVIDCTHFRPLNDDDSDEEEEEDD